MFLFLDALGVDTQGYFQAMRMLETKALAKEYSAQILRMRFAIHCNILALLFGPLWYYSKGMWLKGSAIISGWIVCGLLLSFLAQFVGPLVVVAGVLAYMVLISMCANLDYYYFIKRNERVWPGVPFLGNTAAAGLVHTVAGLAIVFCLILAVVIASGGSGQTPFLAEISQQLAGYGLIESPKTGDAAGKTQGFAPSVPGGPQAPASLAANAQPKAQAPAAPAATQPGPQAANAPAANPQPGAQAPATPAASPQPGPQPALGSAAPAPPAVQATPPPAAATPAAVAAASQPNAQAAAAPATPQANATAPVPAAANAPNAQAAPVANVTASAAPQSDAASAEELRAVESMMKEKLNKQLASEKITVKSVTINPSKNNPNEYYGVVVVKPPKGTERSWTMHGTRKGKDIDWEMVQQ